MCLCCQIAAAEFNLADSKMLPVIAIYRIPSDEYEQCIRDPARCIDRILAGSLPTVHAGDFNIDIWSDRLKSMPCT